MPSAKAGALALVIGTAILGAVLLALSLLPVGALAERLLGAAGEADRGGIHTRELLTNFGSRLRFAGLAFCALAAALWTFRSATARLLAAVDMRRGVRPRIGLVEAALLAGVTLAALGLRLVFIEQPVRYDEALTFNEFASRPLYYALSYYPDPNNHLLNTLLMHIAYVAFGGDRWVLRLPALLAGVALVPATYLFARVLQASVPTAALAAVLVAVSSYLIDYSTNGRGYTLQALCFIALLALVELSVRGRSRTALLLAALVAALGMYAVPTMLYGIAIAAVWLALRWRPWPDLAAAGALCALLVLLLYLPVVLISGPEVLVGNRFVVPLAPGELASELPRTVASTWRLWNRDLIWPLVVVLLAGFAFEVIREVRQRRVPLGLLAPSVCLVLILVQRVAPFERVWLFLLPLYFVVAATGLARYSLGLAPIAAVAMAAGVLASGSILSSGETGVFPDAAAVAQVLRGELRPDDAVVTQLPASLPQLQYEFPRAGLSTAPLVRDPAQAARLFAITRPTSTDLVPGWRAARMVAEFATATLVEMERAS